MCVCVGGGGVRSRAGQSQQEGPDLDMVVKFHWLKGGWWWWWMGEGGRFIGCYLWSSLFTWWVAENENPPQQKKKN